MEENKNVNANENLTNETKQTEVKVETKNEIPKQPTLEELQEKILQLEAEKEAREESYSRLKQSFDKASSDVSKYKKDLQAKLTADEVKALELKEQQEAREKEYAEMKKELNINKATKEYLAYGLEEKDAEACAKAQEEGDLGFILKTLKADKEATIKKEKAEWYNQRPDPEVGGELGVEEDPFLKGFKIGSK